MDSAPGNHSVDDISKAIIEQLQEDGRRSYAAIGKAVGLSEAAVRQRVQKLTDSGIVQIVAVTDPLQLGFPRQAMLGIMAFILLALAINHISLWLGNGLLLSYGMQALHEVGIFCLFQFLIFKEQD